MIRSLYDCLFARYPDNVFHFDYVWCSKGHRLSNGYIHKRQVDREDRLVCRICAICKDFVDMNDIGTEFIREG